MVRCVDSVTFVKCSEYFHKDETVYNNVYRGQRWISIITIFVRKDTIVSAYMRTDCLQRQFICIHKCISYSKNIK